ncbi:MAG: hypothetical protein AB7H97_02995 [Pseudobdellovibrionaceae bacterium]
MLKKIKRSGTALVTLMSLFFGTQAIAGIHLEPFVGYAMSGKMKTDSFTVAGTTVPAGDDSYTGSTLGARVGYSFLGLLGAIEYEMGTLSVDSASITNLGLTVGYTFPILLRAYATYVPSSKISLKDSDVEMMANGTGTKLGVGYTGLPFVALNFEMAAYTYEKADLKFAAMPASDGEYTINGTATHYAINVSLPFNF